MTRGLALLFVVLFATPAGAAEKPPAELEEMRAAFAAAVVKNDASAAAKLSAFPLRNTAYRAPKSIPASKFKAQMRMYVELAGCLKSQPLQPATKNSAAAAGEWEIDCDGNVVAFGLRNGNWRHTGYENVNE